MWLWVGSLPLSWLFGVPFVGLPGSLFFLMSPPSLPLAVAMVVVVVGMGLLARSALNY
jgi:hypothetical protein